MSNKTDFDDFIEVRMMGAEKRTICVAFCDFEELPHQLGDKTVSPPFSCHGYSWKIVIYPGVVSLYLYAILPGNEDGIQVKYTLRVGSKHVTNKHKFTEQAPGGWEEFVRREQVLNKFNGFLERDGSLRVFVDIQVYRDKPPTWKPGKSLHKDMLWLLGSKRGADAVFDINGTEFSAHSIILSRRASGLTELVEGANRSNIPLPGVDPDMFRVFLNFIYTDEIPSDIDFQAMLELANRFGCSRLKLLAESEIVEKGINAENAADLLLLADSNSCALLYEAAIGYITANTQLIMESNGWKRVEESPKLMSEVMRMCFSRKRSASTISEMSVAKLHQKLDDKRLDVNGTRQMLIDRLEQAEAITE